MKLISYPLVSWWYISPDSESYNGNILQLEFHLHWPQLGFLQQDGWEAGDDEVRRDVLASNYNPS